MIPGTHIIEATYIIAVVLFILSLKWLSSPATARRGVWAGEAGMLLAIVGTLMYHGIVEYKWIAIALVLGTMVAFAVQRFAFFGRDTLFTTYAINSYGDFALTRRALDFLIHRQREDGKIMHEFSQSAAVVNWTAMPYFYAAADSTPLFIMSMCDYVKASGETEYLKRNWEAVRKAYQFTRAHETSDGIYANTEGTGWVESWIPSMPQQEIYLAALDEQASLAFSNLAHATGHEDVAAQAKDRAAKIRATHSAANGSRGSKNCRADRLSERRAFAAARCCKAVWTASCRLGSRRSRRSTACT